MDIFTVPLLKNPQLSHIFQIQGYTCAGFLSSFLLILVVDKASLSIQMPSGPQQNYLAN